jgi:hypothetical protein
VELATTFKFSNHHIHQFSAASSVETLEGIVTTVLVVLRRWLSTSYKSSATRPMTIFLRGMDGNSHFYTQLSPIRATSYETLGDDNNQMDSTITRRRETPTNTTTTTQLPVQLETRKLLLSVSFFIFGSWPTLFVLQRPGLFWFDLIWFLAHWERLIWIITLIKYYKNVIKGSSTILKRTQFLLEHSIMNKDKLKLKLGASGFLKTHFHTFCMIRSCSKFTSCVHYGEISL